MLEQNCLNSLQFTENIVYNGIVFVSLRNIESMTCRRALRGHPSLFSGRPFSSRKYTDRCTDVVSESDV